MVAEAKSVIIEGVVTAAASKRRRAKSGGKTVELSLYTKLRREDHC